MTYSLLRFAHFLGAILIGAGLIGVWMSDLRSRQLRELHAFSEAVRNIAVFYDGVVVPGAILLLASGGWLIWAFTWLPRSSVGASADAPASRWAKGRWSGQDCIPTRSVGTRIT